MIKGSIVALITPMHEDGRIDFENLRRLVDFHADSGTAAIVSVGTSGESATLNVDEQIEVIRRTVEFADGRLPVIAGSGANSTSEALELTSRAAALGVAACLLVVPYYNKPTQHGLYLHFRALAEGADVAQILYNVPSRTALDMENDTVAQLAEIPNITGIKDATGDIARVGELRRRCGKDFAIYSGDDATTLELLKAGGDGCISVTANAAPKQMREMCDAALRGDLDEAARINRALDPLHAALFRESNPIPAKWAVSQLGFAHRGIRLPLTWLSERHHAEVGAAMKGAGATAD
ncbi:MAG: 4-hydroxy-tetrahydrodipicolinate synthase [Gammaproteobacteria bacterium]|nr:4-hydroxy-tetrahydrodipicolinate synthase [Gammaproteobacteria bacterium]CAJ2376876.1 MAG: 4-hydroxy-tetrahydrodipicolinate synthase [Arenicellales bacterium IbO2]MDA7962521.1 4-hydroxy-tetrahydrodipicolinate synthase [Gammaproteobacteria bacterium]MDA7970497.1 4-hydroxy-tetrahydrodipicolinate synthase [Gammaproteobacteria bacterium]MDA7971810.1 4-hydroxy-tetrahydrodipicolinate synthase [Gammaproteobacteria bacterium]